MVPWKPVSMENANVETFQVVLAKHQVVIATQKIVNASALKIKHRVLMDTSAPMESARVHNVLFFAYWPITISKLHIIHRKQPLF